MNNANAGLKHWTVILALLEKAEWVAKIIREQLVFARVHVSPVSKEFMKSSQPINVQHSPVYDHSEEILSD